jgi:hypothetical protein
VSECVNKIIMKLREIIVTDYADRGQHALITEATNSNGRWICDWIVSKR